MVEDKKMLPPTRGNKCGRRRRDQMKEVLKMDNQGSILKKEKMGMQKMQDLLMHGKVNM